MFLAVDDKLRAPCGLRVKPTTLIARADSEQKYYSDKPMLEALSRFPFSVRGPSTSAW